MKNQRVLITGGAGFIGSNLAGELAGENEVVILDDLSTGRMENIKELLEKENIRFIRGSITDLEMLHIRRGDYVSNPETNKYHGLCPADFYQKALKKITSRIENPYFFIFSDEPEWAQENLDFEHRFKFITHNGAEKSYEDLRLMSLCKHNIIANSSFSWWGAWLNKNPEKIVIAPRKWFNDPSINTDDLIPENWIRI